MRKSIGIILLAAVMCLQACDKNVFYAAERDVDESGWNMKEPVVFDVNIEDTLQVYDFFIDVRNSVHYTKANTFFFINTTFPDGSVAYDTLECPLAVRVAMSTAAMSFSAMSSFLGQEGIISRYTTVCATPMWWV